MVRLTHGVRRARCDWSTLAERRWFAETEREWLAECEWSAGRREWFRLG